MGKSLSPKSQQRLRVMDAYRGRGRRNSNLWLGYSVKLGQDCIVATDRQLVHWIVFLEIDPAVKSFDLSAQSTAATDDAPVHFVEVTRINDGRETHRVICDDLFADDVEQDSCKSTEPGTLRVFRDVDLKPNVRLALRWAKALAYAEVIREQKHTPVVVALSSALISRRAGDVGDVIEDLSDFDEPTVFGVLVRLAIGGHVSLDLTRSGLCYATPWKWNDEVQNVVA